MQRQENGVKVFQEPEQPIIQETWVQYAELDDSTSPDEIARVQRRDVKQAIRDGYHTADVISDHLDLHQWVVERRMAELRDEEPVTDMRELASRSRTQAVNACRRELVRGLPMTSHQLVLATGLTRKVVCNALMRNPTVFRPIRPERKAQNKGSAWELAESHLTLARSG